MFKNIFLILNTNSLNTLHEIRVGLWTLNEHNACFFFLLIEVVKHKWDRMNIICRQPFCRNVQLGLSFVGVKPVEAPISEVRCAPKSTTKSVEAIQEHFFGKMLSRLV